MQYTIRGSVDEAFSVAGQAETYPTKKLWLHGQASRARDLHVEWLACDLRLQVACVTCACEWRVVSCVCAWRVATCACVIRGERVPAMQVHACKDPADDDSKAVVRARCVTCVAGVHALVCHAHASCT